MTTPQSSEFDKQFATTLARGLELLRCFSPQRPTLSNGELSALTGLSRPTVSRFTYTLMKLGYLTQERRSGNYELGTAVVALGYPLLANLALRQAARPAMTKLAEQLEGSVSLGLRDRLNIVYLETSRGRSTLSNRVSDIGMSHPIVATAIGRAYLCACTPEERSALINECKVKTPELWKCHEAAVNESIAGFGTRRFCVSLGDLRPDIHAVAVPLRRTPNAEIAVFNCVVQAFQLRAGELENDLGPRLLAMVQSLELMV
ncbi:Pca regulon regulatory protein [Pigmentiphaga humi]|uniref:Pca regulon regulatory protein n=1 Tax=Pigmentiphaga humi TaxID=2478468 RepID=A0A3P4B9D9_9BURK|nr:IclR family transcriptional regulator [Pigmentiphaga humi]VCU71765.1 Pca regulon regulatory protein [Pigmentiphaga humi]